MASPIHQLLIDGFRFIEDKNALAWAVLDSKSELLIATSINRRAGSRIAHIEYSRTDLVILHRPIQISNRHLSYRAGTLRIKYEAKAGQLFDFAPRANTEVKYLGGSLNDDMANMILGSGAGIYFISDASDPRRHLKYFRGHTSDLVDARRVLTANVTQGSLVEQETIDCGSADGTRVKIHMLVFDPKRTNGG